MGVAKDSRHNRRDEAKARTQAGRRVQRTEGGEADWESVDGDLLKKAIACIAYRDGALRLGYTRDGGAYAVGVYGDGEPYTDYIRPNESIEAYLTALIGTWEAAS